MSQGRIGKAIAHYRQLLASHNAQAEAALSAAHQHTLSLIQPQLDALYRQMADKLANDETIPLSWLYEANRLKNIRDMISGRISQFAAIAHAQTTQQQHLGVTLGLQASQALLEGTVPPGVHYAFGMPSSSAIASIVGATQAGSPLADLFAGFGAEAADGAGKALISGVTLGWNPRRIAPVVQQALDVSRYRALTISRTESLRCYRQANAEMFKANDDVVDGWVWTASLSARSCVACIAMNGTRHSLDETLDAHVNCRCAMAPLTKSWDDILSPLGVSTDGIEDTQFETPNGSDWFDEQDAETQRQILGSQSAYDLYQSGDVSLSDFVGFTTSEDWGRSIRVKSVKEVASPFLGGGHQ